MKTPAWQATTLRDAALILEDRATRQTFVLSVFCKVLRKHADRIERDA